MPNDIFDADDLVELFKDCLTYLRQHNYTKSHQQYVILCDPDRDPIASINVDEMEAFIATHAV
jgi:hypothetical protein